jgi:hypothetical protein
MVEPREYLREQRQKDDARTDEDQTQHDFESVIGHIFVEKYLRRDVPGSGKMLSGDVHLLSRDVVDQRHFRGV